MNRRQGDIYSGARWPHRRGGVPDRPQAILGAVVEGSSKPGVGYRGQRYEVRYIQEETGQEKVIGWCNAADGGGLLRSALLWPEVATGEDGKRRVWVVDLRPEEADGGPPVP